MRQYNIFDIERLAEKRFQGRIKDKNKGIAIDEILDSKHGSIKNVMTVVGKLRKYEGKKTKYNNNVFVDLVAMIEGVEYGKKNK